MAPSIYDASRQQASNLDLELTRKPPLTQLAAPVSEEYLQSLLDNLSLTPSWCDLVPLMMANVQFVPPIASGSSDSGGGSWHYNAEEETIAKKTSDDNEAEEDRSIIELEEVNPKAEMVNENSPINVSDDTEEEEADDSADDSDEFPPNEFVYPVRIIYVNCYSPQCEMTFPTVCHLEKHLVDSHRIYEYRCYIGNCTYSSTNVTKLLKHRQARHGDSSSWKCNHCDVWFDNHSALAFHVETAHHSGSFQCGWKNCTFRALTQQPVKDHFAQEHQEKMFAKHGSEEEKRRIERNRRRRLRQEFEEASPAPVADSGKVKIIHLRCFVKHCGEYTLTYEDLVEHLLTVHSVRAFICLTPNCKESFTTSHQLIAHTRSAHSDVSTWNCVYCCPTVPFTNPVAFFTHVVDHHQPGNFLCSFPSCECLGKYRSEVIEHFNEKHGQKAAPNAAEISKVKARRNE